MLNRIEPESAPEQLPIAVITRAMAKPCADDLVDVGITGRYGLKPADVRRLQIEMK